MSDTLPFWSDMGVARPAAWLAQQFASVPQSWQHITEPFRQSDVGQRLIQRIEQEPGEIYPQDVFAALHATSLQDVQVVILGQDPYHGPGQAHGLAFSVRPGVAIPPSLRNIRKELQRDLGMTLPEHGCLQAWADEGVLLLNTVLTVAPGQAASHAGWGWEVFTDEIIRAVAAQSRSMVFMLWGAHAQKKKPLIEAASVERAGHLILEANHPSPLSATRGPVPFIGCGHFSRAAAFCASKAKPLRWTLD